MRFFYFILIIYAYIPVWDKAVFYPFSFTTQRLAASGSPLVSGPGELWWPLPPPGVPSDFWGRDREDPEAGDDQSEVG